MTRISDPVERLWSKITKGAKGECWTWGACHYPQGYGMFYWDGRLQRVHRIVYELVVGPIPAGLVIDHLCRNRGCCNPDHLEPVTNRENMLRGVGASAMNARKTHCPSGHAYDDHNTLRRPDGSRYCRECSRLRASRNYYKSRRNREDAHGD